MLLEEVSDHNGFKDDRKRVTFLLIVSLTNLSTNYFLPQGLHLEERRPFFLQVFTYSFRKWKWTFWYLFESESFDIYWKVKVLTSIGKWKIVFAGISIWWGSGQTGGNLDYEDQGDDDVVKDEDNMIMKTIWKWCQRRGQQSRCSYILRLNGCTRQLINSQSEWVQPSGGKT